MPAAVSGQVRGMTPPGSVIPRVTPTATDYGPDHHRTVGSLTVIPPRVTPHDRSALTGRPTRPEQPGQHAPAPGGRFPRCLVTSRLGVRVPPTKPAQPAWRSPPGVAAASRQRAAGRGVHRRPGGRMGRVRGRLWQIPGRDRQGDRQGQADPGRAGRGGAEPGALAPLASGAAATPSAWGSFGRRRRPVPQGVPGQAEGLHPARLPGRRRPIDSGTEPPQGRERALRAGVRHKLTLRASIQTMNRPTPTSDEPPPRVGPRTLKIEPNRKNAAATRPATASQRPTRPVRQMANESAATRAVIVQTIGVRPCSWLRASTAAGWLASATPIRAVSAALDKKPRATNTPPLIATAMARLSSPTRQMTGVRAARNAMKASNASPTAISLASRAPRWATW